MVWVLGSSLTLGLNESVVDCLATETNSKKKTYRKQTRRERGRGKEEKRGDQQKKTNYTKTTKKKDFQARTAPICQPVLLKPKGETSHSFSVRLVRLILLQHLSRPSQYLNFSVIPTTFHLRPVFSYLSKSSSRYFKIILRISLKIRSRYSGTHQGIF